MRRSGVFGGVLALMLAAASASQAQQAAPQAALAAGQGAARPGEPQAVRLSPSPAERAALQQALRGNAAAGEGGRGLLVARGLDPALVNRSPVPVLIPDLPGTSARLFLVPDVQPQAYAASIDMAGQSLVIIGSAKAYAPPPGAPPVTLSATDAFGDLAVLFAYRATHPNAPPPAPGSLPQSVHISRTEYGVDLSFSQFGAPYQVSLMCADPDNDPRCSEGAAMLLLVRMILVGGGSGW